MENIIKNFTIDELNELMEVIKNRKVEIRNEEKENRKERNERLHNEMKDKVNKGDKVKFLFGTKNEVYEGEVVRTSPKTTTIYCDKFIIDPNKGTKEKYIKYERIIEVL